MAVIVSVSIIDNLLEHCIKLALHKDKKVFLDLFNGSGALSNFSARINIGFMIGLYSKNVWRDLNIIRKIRNFCAHHYSDASFNRADLKDQAMSLNIWKDYSYPALGNWERETPAKIKIVPVYDPSHLHLPRHRFMITFQALTYIFTEAVRNRPPMPTPAH